MNIFVLCTGRCGSTTFIRACQHIKNYSSGHETLANEIFDRRLDYPNNHIEADNRLTWFLGRLDEKYGNNAYYVHLTRNIEDCANSFVKRWEYGIMKAYRSDIIMCRKYDNITTEEKKLVAKDYLHTVNENIRCFLKDKTKKLYFELENATENFIHFCNQINADIDINNALNEFNIKYNASR